MYKALYSINPCNRNDLKHSFPSHLMKEKEIKKLKLQIIQNVYISTKSDTSS